MIDNWIPVAERLPDEHINCLVICDDGIYIISHRDAGIWEVEKRDWNDSKVTHWQPLPEPPETE